MTTPLYTVLRAMDDFRRGVPGLESSIRKWVSIRSALLELEGGTESWVRRRVTVICDVANSVCGLCLAIAVTSRCLECPLGRRYGGCDDDTGSNPYGKAVDALASLAEAAESGTELRANRNPLREALLTAAAMIEVLEGLRAKEES